MSKQKRKMPSHSMVFHHWRMMGLKPAKNKQTCFRCGYTAPDKLNLERAHIIARCNGGPDHVDNLVICCHHCHVFTDGWTRDEWVHFLKTKEEPLDWPIDWVAA